MAQNTSEFSALRRTAAALHGFAALTGGLVSARLNDWVEEGRAL